MSQVTVSFTLVFGMASLQKLGLIAGNGKFPFLVLDAARAQGFEVVVAAIREEAFPEIESKGAASVHWVSLGELSKLIDTFKAEGVTRAVMAGQVKHKQIFSAIKPDWRLAKLLLSLGTRNTDSLLGAVAKVLADEGIVLENSTALLEPLLAKTGVLTKRAPSEQERKNIEYGRAVARRLAEYDIGQTVVIAEAACVTVEAMEGTDATIERAGELMRSLDVTRTKIGSEGRGFDAEPGADGGEDRKADAGYALRRSGDWGEDDRDDGARRGELSGGGRGAMPAAGWRGDDAGGG